MILRILRCALSAIALVAVNGCASEFLAKHSESIVATILAAVVIISVISLLRRRNDQAWLASNIVAVLSALVSISTVVLMLRQNALAERQLLLVLMQLEKDDADRAELLVASTSSAAPGERRRALITLLRAKRRIESLETLDGRSERIDLRGANLAGVNLSYLDLRGVDLTEADLRGANLKRANLSGSVLRSANLSLYPNASDGAGCVRLDFADLREADLSDADLSSAVLLRAKISDMKISSKTNFDQAALLELDGKLSEVATTTQSIRTREELQAAEESALQTENTTLANLYRELSRKLTSGPRE